MEIFVLLKLFQVSDVDSKNSGALKINFPKLLRNFLKNHGVLSVQESGNPAVGICT